MSIGPSTGWLYAIGVNSLVQQRTISEDAGANAVEFCIGTSLEPTDVRVASMLEEKSQPFVTTTGSVAWHYRSLHLPDYKPDVKPATQAEMARKIAVSQVASTMLIHPLKIEGEYPIGYYDQLSSQGRGSGIRFAIENMDKNKPNGFLLRELKKLVETCDLAFVLDVQHAYEHDSSMQYAQDLFHAMRGRISHLHVSGETQDNNHCLLHRARNAKPLVEFLGEIFASLGDQPCPIILEGQYQTANDIAEEIAFIRKEVYEPQLVVRLMGDSENEDIPMSFWGSLPELLKSTDLGSLDERAKDFVRAYRAHLSFGSILPGLETLGSGIRSAIQKAKLNPDYASISDAQWREIGMDISDPRCYYIAGCGHVTPDQSELDESVRLSADSLLREKHR